MSDDFSIREYLINNGLTDQEGELITGPGLENPDWGILVCGQPETILRLCTLVYFFEREGMLDNLKIAIRRVDENRKLDENGSWFDIDIDQIERRFDSFNWDVVLDTIDFLEKHMAPSNISYLAGQLFSEN